MDIFTLKCFAKIPKYDSIEQISPLIPSNKNMNYSRIQKWLSSFLIFSILFLQTFEVPLLSTTRAEAKVNADIVSFIVDEDIYGGGVKSKILQYAKDIQAYLPNTRVVIFPVQKTANPFLIASINEKLFYEGDGEGFSRLVGTILI
jgi:hypothetical protein